MLSKINRFFQRLSMPLDGFMPFDNQQDSHSSDQPLSLEIACAVLLCEVMRADGEFNAPEQTAIQQTLSEQFSLSETEVAEIIQLALSHSEDATDFHRFTSKVNQVYSLEQRIDIVKLLWVIAQADGTISRIEEHTIRRIADLLHLRHSEYIATKPSA